MNRELASACQTDRCWRRLALDVLDAWHCWGRAPLGPAEYARLRRVDRANPDSVQRGWERWKRALREHGCPHEKLRWEIAQNAFPVRIVLVKASVAWARQVLRCLALGRWAALWLADYLRGGEDDPGAAARASWGLVPPTRQQRIRADLARQRARSA